jgi:hypothetical protein
MVSQGEMRMWQDINSIATSLNRIANLMEAAEMRVRKESDRPAERSGLIGSNELDHGPDGFPL